MVKAANRFIITLFFVLSSFFGVCQQSILEQKKSIEFKKTSLEKCLYQLERAYQISFSYNPDHFEIGKKITQHFEDQRLIDIIKSITGNQTEVKQIGNTVILKSSSTYQASKKIKYDISGVIYDAETGEKISEVSIYLVDGVRSALSTQSGNYKIKVNTNTDFVRLSYNHKRYRDTIIIVKPSEIQNVKVKLYPKYIEPIAPRKIGEIPIAKRSLDSSTIVKILVPKKKRRLIDNIPFLGEPQPIQLSFLPTIGTNLSMNGAMENKASVNLLAGYSRAVDGFEVGGLLNIVREDVKGTQISGFGNMVGGKVDGFQAAGFFNNVKGSVDGAQLAGFSNVVLDSVDGLQAAGFLNITKGHINGAQLAGYFNLCTKSVDGQASGYANIAFDTVRKIQISGFGNYAKRVEGVQASGFINIAKSVKGLQMSAFNIADTIEKGAAIGLISFVRKGYHPLETSYTDINSYSLRLKTGTRKFYNILEAGISSGKFTHWHFNYGIGHSFILRKKKSYADLELTSGVINPNTGFNTYFNLINKLELNFSYKLIGPVYLFFGPALNAIVSNNNFVRPFDTPFNMSSKINSGNISIENYIGYRFGLRI